MITEGSADAAASVPPQSANRFCDLLPEPALYCADFVRDPTTPMRAIQLNGVTEVTGERFRSSPRAARAAINATGIARQAGYAIDFSSDRVRDHARLTYSVYLDVIPTSGELLLGGPTFVVSGVSHSFNVTIGSSGATLVERKTAASANAETRTSPTPLSKAFPIGVWKRLSIDVSLALGFVRVILDDVVVAGQGVNYAIPGKLVPFVGIEAATADANKGTVFIDDIVLEE